jgi:glycopeptide antibiotics resistance protein
MRWRQQLASAVLVVYTMLLLLALLAPTSEQQAGLVLSLGRVLGEMGVPGWLTSFERLEVVMNALIIAPVTFLGSMVRPQLGWRDWTAYGFAASLTVEAVQLLLLPGRDGSFSDVVANTFGALLGAVVFHAVRAGVFAVAPGLRYGRTQAS